MKNTRCFVVMCYSRCRKPAVPYKYSTLVKYRFGPMNAQFTQARAARLLWCPVSGVDFFVQNSLRGQDQAQGRCWVWRGEVPFRWTFTCLPRLDGVLPYVFDVLLPRLYLLNTVIPFFDTDKTWLVLFRFCTPGSVISNGTSFLFDGGTVSCFS